MEKDKITIPKNIYELERTTRIFGSSLDEISKKKFNIFIGVSVNNKKLTKDLARTYLRWALYNTKDKVAIVIADELDIVNREVFDKYSKGKARKRALKDGDKFESLFKKIISEFSKKDREKINIYRWNRIVENQHFLDIKKFLRKQYKCDIEFRFAISFFVKKYIRKKGRLKILEDKKKLDKLAEYMFGELPTLLEGIQIGGTHYDLCLYPTYFASGMSQFITDIWEEELNVSKKLKRKLKHKAVLVESWLD